jgi:hypothetical protein
VNGGGLEIAGIFINTRISRTNSVRTGHILRRNCLLKHAFDEKIERKERQGRRCKQLLDDLMETRRYRKLKEKALDRTLWRTRFGSVYGRVA